MSSVKLQIQSTKCLWWKRPWWSCDNPRKPTVDIKWHLRTGKALELIAMPLPSHHMLTVLYCYESLVVTIFHVGMRETSLKILQPRLELNTSQVSHHLSWCRVVFPFCSGERLKTNIVTTQTCTGCVGTQFERTKPSRCTATSPRCCWKITFRHRRWQSTVWSTGPKVASRCWLEILPAHLIHCSELQVSCIVFYKILLPQAGQD